MFKLKTILSVLTVAFISNASFGMDLSLVDATAKILEESEDLKISEFNLKKAEAGLDAVNSSRWFQINGSATYTNMVDMERPFQSGGSVIPGSMAGMLPPGFSVPTNTLGLSVELSQPIYTFGKIGNAVDAMESAIKMSESGVELARREIEYAAINLYWTAVMTDGLVDIYQTSLNDAKSARKRLTAVGRAQRSNLVKIESDIASKEITLSDAKFNRDTAYRMLKIFAGIEESVDIKLTDVLPQKFEELNVAKTLESNPQWDILDEEIRMYESNASAQRASRYPTLAAFASYGYNAFNDDVNVFETSGSQSGTVGLALQMSIFDGGLSRANATMEVMNAEIATNELLKSKKLVGEEYNVAIKKYDHLRGQLSDLNNAKDLARKSYNLSRDRFTSGQTSAVELSEVSTALSQVDIALLNAKYNLLMSAAEIKKLGE